MIAIVRLAMIATAIILFPAWKLWISGGWIADRLAQRRHQIGN